MKSTSRPWALSVLGTQVLRLSDAEGTRKGRTHGPAVAWQRPLEESQRKKGPGEVSAAGSGTLQRILSVPAAVPAAGRARAGEMLQEESDLSLIIAQIVQKLKGSNLYAQLERQAWVSGADGKLWRPAGRRTSCLPHCLHPSQSCLLFPTSFGVLNPSLSPAPWFAQTQGWGDCILLKMGGAHHAFLQAREWQRRLISLSLLVVI